MDRKVLIRYMYKRKIVFTNHNQNNNIIIHEVRPEAELERFMILSTKEHRWDHVLCTVYSHI